MNGGVLDRKALLESLDNDEQLLDQVIDVFLADCPRQLAALRTAVSARDAEQIMKASHALKGSVSVFGAVRAVEETQRLESLGRQGTFEGVGDSVAGVEREIADVVSALATIVAERP